MIIKCFCAALALASPAAATVIDFEAQGAGAAAIFNATVDSPLTIGVATLFGGKLLKGEAGSAGGDSTAVYGTDSDFAGGFLNPITITFSKAVSGLSLEITNELADTYTLSANSGGSNSVSTGLVDNEILSVAAGNITSATVSSSDPGDWDFAIDNITFTVSAPASAVPEPSQALPLVALFAAAGLVRLRAFEKRRRSTNGLVDESRANPIGS